MSDGSPEITGQKGEEDTLLRLFDCHIHSTHSSDARSSVDELCESAIEYGLHGICVTDHIEFDEAESGYGYFDYDAYIADVLRCRKKYGDKLVIKTGVEVTYQTEYERDIWQFLKDYEFDFILGSVHMIGHTSLLDPDYFTGKTEEEAYRLYWREVLAMVDSGLFQYIGHLDYIKRPRPQEYGPFDFQRWAPQITEIVRRIIESGAIPEVNTSALRMGFAEPYPSWRILRLYKSLGGTRVVLGSDAHSYYRVGWEFREVAAELSRLGLVVCEDEIFSGQSARWTG
jgi:histidinol-phosphatase (PHP family)